MTHPPLQTVKRLHVSDTCIQVEVENSGPVLTALVTERNTTLFVEAVCNANRLSLHPGFDEMSHIFPTKYQTSTDMCLLQYYFKEVMGKKVDFGLTAHELED